MAEQTVGGVEVVEVRCDLQLDLLVEDLEEVEAVAYPSQVQEALVALEEEEVGVKKQGQQRCLQRPS